MRGEHVAWSRFYGHEDEHAAMLVLGLRRLGLAFCANICSICEGRGIKSGTYDGGCYWCAGLGLLQDNGPAHFSVVNQVIEAAK